MEEKESTGGDKKRHYDQEEIYANAVRAGKRTYFFDVRTTRAGEFYLTITESKRRYADDGTFTYQKHKLFLYKEDFEKFTDAMSDAVKKVIELNTERDSKVADKVENSFTDVNFEDLGSKDDKEETSEQTGQPAAKESNTEEITSEAPAEESPAEEAPAEETPAEAPAEESPAEETPAEAPAEESPAEEAPAEESNDATAESTDSADSSEKSLSFEEMTSADLMEETVPAEEKKEE